MNHENFARMIRERLRASEATGQTSIEIADLLKELERLERDADEQGRSVLEADLDAFRRDNEAYLAEFGAYLSARNDSAIKMFDSVILAGQNAIRILMTINGGAAIAVLAFMSHLAVNDAGTVPHFVPALSFFTYGILAIGISAGATYLAQLFFSGEGKFVIGVGYAFQVVAILGGLASVFMFGVGMMTMGDVFRNFAELQSPS